MHRCGTLHDSNPRPSDRLIFNKWLGYFWVGLCNKIDQLAPIVQRVDNFIQWIKGISWSTFYPLDSDLSDNNH